MRTVGHRAWEGRGRKSRGTDCWARLCIGGTAPSNCQGELWIEVWCIAGYDLRGGLEQRACDPPCESRGFDRIDKARGSLDGDASGISRHGRVYGLCGVGFDDRGRDDGVGDWRGDC